MSNITIIPGSLLPGKFQNPGDSSILNYEINDAKKDGSFINPFLRPGIPATRRGSAGIKGPLFKSGIILLPNQPSRGN
jgi:hypothetical protein